MDDGGGLPITKVEIAGGGEAFRDDGRDTTMARVEIAGGKGEMMGSRSVEISS